MSLRLYVIRCWAGHEYEAHRHGPETRELCTELTAETGQLCLSEASRVAERPGFDGKLDVVFLDDGRLELQTALTYYAADGRAFHMPAGFTTDLASVPRLLPGLFRLLFRSELHTALAAVLHDRLYYTGEVSRAEADALFREALQATHESTVGAAAMWLGVRGGGWFAWRKHRGGRG
jgi:hypothetical protein